MTAPEIQGLVLFEVYEANGSLLVVTSSLHDVELSPGDKVYRRPWATAAPPEEYGPKHRPTAANCTTGGPGAPISSGLVCQACPTIGGH